MMFKQIIAVGLVTILGLVSAQDTTPSVCSTGCVNGVFVNAAGMGCANGDTLCVCGKTDSFYGGIRDCVSQACAPDGPDAQIPLAEAYANEICANAVASSAPPPPPAPTSSTAPAPSEAEPTVTEAPVTTSTPAASTSTATPVSSTESSSQSITTSTTVASTEASSSASDTTATSVPVSSQTTSKSTSVSSSPTTSSTSQPVATSSASEATPGLSTAVKAGIGAGVGAAALAAIIITVCVCLRRRQRNKTSSHVRNYKISEPLSASNREFGNDYNRAEAGLPKPIITTLPVRADPMGMATSPTSLYSTNSSDLESHTRRYEDMMPRTQPRTMI
ncbi:hypothetical protein E0Z10_g6385 [Xylaria hypoxylon]|uniref:CFEM domain-containing protein n=1 Tax=Xylaria hypoxylon TaxID=37992 RepID=A0A4Z0Z137_9PEZI|nr:hypothetical protein E0Z10_g6385 [Xylaria hypoxylon]